MADPNTTVLAPFAPAPLPPAPVGRRAGPLARLALAVSLVSMTGTVVVPIVVATAITVEAILVVLAAVALQHTGGFKLEHFGLAMWGGIAAMVTASSSSSAARRRRDRARAHLATTPAEEPDSDPVLVTGLFLAVLTPLVVYAEWDKASWLPVWLATAMVMASLCFFGIVAPFSFLGIGYDVVRTLYRWGAKSGFRAVLVSGAALLLAMSALSSPANNPAIGTSREKDWADEAIAQIKGASARASGAGPSTKVRAVLEAVAGMAEPRAAIPHRAGIAAAPGAHLPVVHALSPGGSGGMTSDDCAKELDRTGQVKDAIGFVERSRFSPADALDIVWVAVTKTCIDYDPSRVKKLDKFFISVVMHGMVDHIRRVKVRDRCAALLRGEEASSCASSPESWAGASEILSVIDEALCSLDDAVARAIFLDRYRPGVDFEALGRKFGLTEAQAKNKLDYVLKQVKERLRERGCEVP